MASFVNAADVVDSAVEIERRGHEFYKKAADRAATPEGREFFTFMASEEQRHEHIFSEMLKRLGGLPLPDSVSEQEYRDYVAIILDSHCLFMGKEALETADPFALALQFEKDTILFFTAMRNMVPESEARQVDLCIEEEKRHIRLIAEKRKAARA